MPEDDKRTADALEEIRDLLIEMRDLETARAEEGRKHMEETRELQNVWAERQRKHLRFARILLVMLAPILLWLLWWMAASIWGAAT